MTPIDKIILDNFTFSINLVPKAQLITAHVQIDNENDRRALQRFLGLWNIEALSIIAQGMVTHQSVGLDMQIMEYPHPKTPSYEGVKVGDGMSYTIHLSNESFDQLMLKLFDKLIDEVQAQKSDLALTDEWSQFLEAVATIRQRNS